MPIFEYHCVYCEETFEKIFTAKVGKTFDDTPEKRSQECPKCGLKCLRIDFSVPAYPLAFYGNPTGYAKPAASKRHSTKLASASGHDNKKKMV